MKTPPSRSVLGLSYVTNSFSMVQVTLGNILFFMSFRMVKNSISQLVCSGTA